MRLGLAFLLVLATHAFGQEAYPSKPIRILIPYAAGGGNDIMCASCSRSCSRGSGSRW